MFTYCHSVANTKAFARSPAEYIKRFLNDRSVSLGDGDNCRSWHRIVWQCTNLAETYAVSFIRVAKECVMFMHIVVRYTCTGLQDDIKQTDRTAALQDFKTMDQWCFCICHFAH